MKAESLNRLQLSTPDADMVALFLQSSVPVPSYNVTIGPNTTWLQLALAENVVVSAPQFPCDGVAIQGVRKWEWLGKATLSQEQWSGRGWISFLVF